MKKLCILFSLVSLPLLAQKNTLELKITGINKVKGKVLIGLFNQEEGFPTSNYFKRVAISPKDKVVKYTFTDLDDGEYALAILHDENENGKMDIGIFGPKEPYGFSNNVRAFMSAPSFEKASFSLTKPKKISVELK